MLSGPLRRAFVQHSCFLFQDIFEETPDKDRFVGDVMFWKFFEDIDANRIYHTNSVEYRTDLTLRGFGWHVRSARRL